MSFPSDIEDEPDFLFKSDSESEESFDGEHDAYVFEDDSSFPSNHSFVPDFIDSWLFSRYKEEGKLFSRPCDLSWGLVWAQQ